MPSFIPLHYQGSGKTFYPNMDLVEGMTRLGPLREKSATTRLYYASGEIVHADGGREKSRYHDVQETPCEIMALLDDLGRKGPGVFDVEPPAAD